MKEIDDFLRGYVTPVLRPRGFRKSSHTYRKGYDTGDWSIFSFRDHPRGFVGSFLAEASLVPEPVWDWFRVTSPSLATKEPQGWWMHWSNPLGPAFATSNWTYETDGEREVVGSMLADRLGEVGDLFDGLCLDPTRLLERVLASEAQRFEQLPLLVHAVRSLVWRACLLCRAGMTEELEAVLVETDPYPALGLRRWAEDYTSRRQE